MTRDPSSLDDREDAPEGRRRERAAVAYESGAPDPFGLESSAVALGARLIDRGWTLALAESCTGGMVAKLVTDVAGSSRYFEGGVVTYSNRAKRSLLGVRSDTLELEGAVSEETAREMVEGAGRLFGAEVALSVTGIAGPGGGSDEKPIGTVWFAVRSPRGERVERVRFSGARARVRACAAGYGLRLLLDAVGPGRGGRPANANPGAPDG